MRMPLTEQQAAVLDRLDKDQSAVIGDKDAATCPGLHFCPDWDGLPICFASPEIHSCTCPKTIAEAIGWSPE